MSAIPPDAGHASHLTAPMLQALHTLNKADPAPGCVTNLCTAVALLNRGFIKKAQPLEPVHSSTLYHITQGGRTAYRIEQAQAGVKPGARAMGA